VPSDSNNDLPISHAIADGWREFAESVLPSVGGADHAQAHTASHFGAMYVLEIVEQVVAQKSVEEAALALGMLDAELDESMKVHAIAVQ
jgi:hypothetical protein